MNLERLSRLAFPLAAVAIMPACAPRIIEMRASDAVSAALIDSASPPVRLGSRPADHHVLVLTSGGADGAFGCGVLTAWSASGRRPAFDVVTGVSTGALQATPAFLGESHDHTLKRIYTTTRTRDVFRFNGLRSLRGAGIYDPAPMRDLLMEIITEKVLDDVASAHRAGRRLYVATTDMTSGKVAYWDMGRIAASDGPRRHHYVNLLIASAAPPGLVEPVRIVGREGRSTALHGDGGVKAPVPLEEFMLPERGSHRARVWVIANGHVSRTSAICSDAETTVPLARRGVAQLLRQLLYSSARGAEATAGRAGADFKLISLPESVPEAANPFEFEPAEMTRLYEAGRKAGNDAFGRPARHP